MSSMKDQLNRLVYSTDQGDLRKSADSGPDEEQERLAALDGIVRIRRETSGRKGKGVTTVRGVPLPRAELKTLAAELKKKCGTGGSLKDDVIEIQGDHRDTLRALLEARGYKVKLAGG